MKSSPPGSVWPSVVTGGELEPAEGEWLHTNGAGAYAMSTLALMHTRRFHGLLVAALEPPLKRHVILSHAETTISVGRRNYSLSTHRFPDIAPTPGYRLLQAFHQDPLPRWTYRLGRGELERRLCLVRGANALILEYTWRGKGQAQLALRPLLPMRPIHQLRSEHGGLLQVVGLKRQQVRIRPVKELPEVVFGHEQVFVGSPDWWRRFEYSEDQRRDVHYSEDLWTPGVFEMVLEPNVPARLTVAVGQLPEGDPEQLMHEAERVLLAQDPGTHHSIPVRVLWIAAEQFRAVECERPATLAGYPWLDVRTRDSLVALPGLYLCQGLYHEACRNLRRLLAVMEDGLLPSGIPEEGRTAEDSPNISVDASLWLFEGARQLTRKLGVEHEFIQSELYPALKAVFERVHRPGRDLVWLDPSGLLASHSPDTPLTWMDARAAGGIVTPRNGMAVELQALWSNACRTLASLAAAAGETEIVERARTAGGRTRQAFLEHFWCKASNYPYDCIDEHLNSTDAAIRPNALLALSLDPELFTRQQAEAIVQRAREKLLTSRGLRTLDPADDNYLGYYEGSMDSRRAAYHQGVVWVYLLGAFARASLRLYPDDFELHMELKRLALSAMQNNPVLGQVAQVAAGDAPHNPGGCPAQAWSVAELLRTLQWGLKL
jgi:predicted glycogen debranching enzyme